MIDIFKRTQAYYVQFINLLSHKKNNQKGHVH